MAFSSERSLVLVIRNFFFINIFFVNNIFNEQFDILHANWPFWTQMRFREVEAGCRTCLLPKACWRKGW